MKIDKNFLRNNDLGLLLLRLTIGGLMLFHGIHKLVSGVGFISGMLVDRLGYKPVLAVSMILTAVGAWLRYLSSGYGMMYAAMVMMGSWYTMNALPGTMKANMESASSTDEPFTMIPINFPDIAGTGNVGSMFCDIDYATAVPATAANQDASVKFAVWLGTSEAGQQIIADSLNVVPVLKTAVPNWDNIELVNPEAQNEAIQEYLANAVDQPENARFGNISADLNSAMMDVLAGVASDTMSVEDGLAQLAEVAGETW